MVSFLYFFQGSKTLLAALLVPGHEAFLISITLTLMSIFFLSTFGKQKPAMVSKIEEEKQLEISSADSSFVPVEAQDQILIASQDLYSESESMDHFSTTSSEDTEWPYNMGQRLDCSDDSISDEESLFEIAIPTGQFVKLSHQQSIFNKDFWGADLNVMNEEDNLIEIDIYMGSIK